MNFAYMETELKKKKRLRGHLINIQKYYCDLLNVLGALVKAVGKALSKA